MEEIKRWIRETGRRHDWLANKMGYTKEHFSRVLNGRVPLTAMFLEKFRAVKDAEKERA